MVFCSFKINHLTQSNGVTRYSSDLLLISTIFKEWSAQLWTNSYNFVSLRLNRVSDSGFSPIAKGIASSNTSHVSRLIHKLNKSEIVFSVSRLVLVLTEYFSVLLVFFRELTAEEFPRLHLQIEVSEFHSPK